VKLENNSSLIYLKAIPDYFNPDHNPMICWTGSGYNLERIQEEKIDDTLEFLILASDGLWDVFSNEVCEVNCFFNIFYFLLQQFNYNNT